MHLSMAVSYSKRTFWPLEFLGNRSRNWRGRGLFRRDSEARMGSQHTLSNCFDTGSCPAVIVSSLKCWDTRQAWKAVIRGKRGAFLEYWHLVSCWSDLEAFISSRPDTWSNTWKYQFHTEPSYVIYCAVCWSWKELAVLQAWMLIITLFWTSANSPGYFERKSGRLDWHILSCQSRRNSFLRDLLKFCVSW